MFRSYRSASFVVLALVVPTAIRAQALGPTSTGPIIDGFGPVYRIDAPTFEIPAGMEIKAVFEVLQAADAEDQLNRRIESVARFLNMHGQAGIPADRVHAALVVHGPAGKDLLDDEGYRSRYGIDNPNAEMVRRLLDAGVEIVLCGQTQMSRGLRRAELIEGVEVGLSAMTALVVFQNQGFAILPS